MKTILIAIYIGHSTVLLCSRTDGNKKLSTTDIDINLSPLSTNVKINAGF